MKLPYSFLAWDVGHQYAHILLSVLSSPEKLMNMDTFKEVLM